MEQTQKQNLDELMEDILKDMSEEDRESTLKYIESRRFK